jgi:hypothetical protein
LNYLIKAYKRFRDDNNIIFKKIWLEQKILPDSKVSAKTIPKTTDLITLIKAEVQHKNPERNVHRK